MLIGVISSNIICRRMALWMKLVNPSLKLDSPFEKILSSSGSQLSCLHSFSEVMLPSQSMPRMDTVHTGSEVALVFVPGHLLVVLTMISYGVFKNGTLTEVSSMVSTVPSSSGMTPICSFGSHKDESFEGAASDT